MSYLPIFYQGMECMLRIKHRISTIRLGLVGASGVVQLPAVT